jgi:hypothetical protein
MPCRGPGTVEITRKQARSVTLLLLVILVAMWVAVLLPPYLRNRSSRSSTSLASFRRLVTTLERTGPDAGPGWRGTLPPRFGGVSPIPMDRVAAMRPIGRAEVRRRRRDILFTLAGAALITLVLAVLLGGIAIWCNLLADVLLATYVVLLVQVRRMAVERQTKVRYLAPRTAPEPATLLVRRRA